MIACAELQQRATRKRTRLQPWQRVWRRGFGPQLATDALEAVRLGLIRDDPRLVQGQTSCPPSVEVFYSDPIEGCCALTFGAWQTGKIWRVADLANLYAQLCYNADAALGELAACHAFLDWYDQAPRRALRRQLLREVNRSLNRRRPAAA